MPAEKQIEPLQQLVNLIDVKATELDCFRGHSVDIGTRNVFGGQVLGQALMAAAKTAPDDRPAHSMHAYFLLPGRHEDIVYQVAKVRDGGSFSTRRVSAHQEDATIFEASVSFHREELGIDRQDPMPSVPGPQGIFSELEIRQSIADRMPQRWREKAILPTGMEYRPLVPFDHLKPRARDAKSQIWLRTSGPLPDSRPIHQALLAYASDHGLLLSAILPHGLSLVNGEVQLASIDHSVWFHREFRIDDWLLYQIDSPSVHGSRAICRGSVFAQDGRLVASTMQEGLLRVVTKPK